MKHSDGKQLSLSANSGGTLITDYYQYYYSHIININFCAYTSSRSICTPICNPIPKVTLFDIGNFMTVVRITIMTTIRYNYYHSAIGE